MQKNSTFDFVYSLLVAFYTITQPAKLTFYINCQNGVCAPSASSLTASLTHLWTKWLCL